MEPGFPRKIAKDFPGVDSKVDAVFEAFGKRTCSLLALEMLCIMRIQKRIKSFLITDFKESVLSSLPRTSTHLLQWHLQSFR